MNTSATTPKTARDTDDLDFYDHVNAKLRLIGGVLAVISTADIETHAVHVGIVLDDLATRIAALRNTVEIWYDNRPTEEDAS